MLHSGYEDDAFALAGELIDTFSECDFVAVNAAGCGSSMKDYGHLMEDDRARAFSDRVKDVSELLAEEGTVAERHPLDMRVVYHDACHLAHAQRIRAEPRALLAEIPGVDVVEPPEWEVCCGSAGIYNLTEPDAAGELGRRKAHNLLSVDPDAIVAGNPGCTLQIAAHLRALGRPLPIYHPMELLWASIEGKKLSAGTTESRRA